MTSLAESRRPRMHVPLVVAAMLLLLGGPATPTVAQHATPEGTNPGDARTPNGERTDVFVLGTSHLSQIRDRFTPHMLDSLLRALKAFRPDAICVESLPGRQVAAMERWGNVFDRITARFAEDKLRYGRIVQHETGLSWSAANRQADSLLAVAQTTPSALPPPTRLRLVQSLTAAYRLPSAALQWSYLPEQTRTAQSVVPDTLAHYLQAYLQSANETASIGLRLARKLEHTRLHPIDAHGSKDLLAEIWQSVQGAYQDSLGAILAQNPTFQREDSLFQAGVDAGSLLPFYRFANSDRFLEAKVNVQFRRVFLTPQFPNAIGQKRIALWETRNLTMAARIRRASYFTPGGRVLVIVGSSHKPFLDRYLRRMMNMEVVEAEEVWNAVD